MGTAVEGRTFPFREHSTAEVREREWLTARYERGERLQHFEQLRLNVLGARVILPPERDPPPAA